jgi:Ca2+-dependent lipid-binding protein
MYYNSLAECHFLCAHREGHNPLFSAHFFIFIQNVAHDLSITLRSSHDKHATKWLQVLMERQDDISSSYYGDLYVFFSKKC